MFDKSRGFIALPRDKEAINRKLTRPAYRYLFWTCVELAAFADHEIPFKGTYFRVQRGELFTTLKYLHEQTGFGVQTIRGFLAQAKKLGFLTDSRTTKNNKLDNKQTNNLPHLIKVNNYGELTTWVRSDQQAEQPADQQPTNNQPTTSERKLINKALEIKEEEEAKETPPPPLRLLGFESEDPDVKIIEGLFPKAKNIRRLVPLWRNQYPKLNIVAEAQDAYAFWLAPSEKKKKDWQKQPLADFDAYLRNWLKNSEGYRLNAEANKPKQTKERFATGMDAEGRATYSE